MIGWHVQLTRPAERDLALLAARSREAVEEKIDQLGQDPFETDIAKLQGTIDRWRVRVGNYRILVRLELDEHIVTVLRVRHRREAYR